MPRIRIEDLPCLQDLTPEQLKELFGAGPRRFRPTLEAFEERMLPSLTPLNPAFLTNVSLGAAAFTPAASAAQPTIHILAGGPAGQVEQAAAANTAEQLSQGTTPLNGALAAVPHRDAAALATFHPVLTHDPPPPGDTGTPGLTPDNIQLSGPAPILPLGVTGLSANDPGVQAIIAYVNQNPGSVGTQVAGVDGTIHANPDGVGRSILFTVGPNEYVTVQWSPRTGAHSIFGTGYDHWLQFGGLNFGYPTNEASNNLFGPMAYGRQDFQGLQPGAYGAIVSSSLGTYEIHGAIYQEWLKSPVQGLIPFTNENRMLDGATPDTGTRYNEFVDPATGQNWVICWTPGDARAHLMKGDIFDKWMSLGGQQYGRVDGDTAAPPEFRGNVYVQKFKGGPKIGTEWGATIVSTPWAGVHEMHGVVRDNVWSGDGPRHFGYAVTDEIRVDSYYLDGTFWTAPFDGLGSRISWRFNITLDPVTGKMFVLYALDQDPGDGPADSWMAIDPHIVSQEAYWTSVVGTLPLDVYNAWYNGSAGNTGTAAQADTAAPNSAAFVLGHVHSSGLVPLSTYRPSDPFALPGQAESSLLANAFVQVNNVVQPLPTAPVVGGRWDYFPDNPGAVPTPGTPAPADTQAPPPADAQAPPAQASPVADFTNVTFSLTDDNGAAHQFQVQAQAAQPDRSATFAGLWDGQGVSGTLAYDAAGNVHVTWSAADGSGFDGTISGAAGAYHLDGSLTAADGTTIHAAGDQAQAPAAQVPDFTGVTFSITGDNGAAYRLQVQSQTAQADGTAAFTALWFAHGSHAGQQVGGTLAYDGAGNVHIVFDYGHGDNFDGAVSGSAGAYRLGGTATEGGAAVHAAGGQAAPPAPHHHGGHHARHEHRH